MGWKGGFRGGWKGGALTVITLITSILLSFS